MADLNLYAHPGLSKYLSPPVPETISEITGFTTFVHRLEDSLWECYRAEREQFNAGCILERFRPYGNGKKSILLTDVDIFLPIFTFVFGLAQLGGSTAIVSIHRLKNEYYGLPKSAAVLNSRIQKEIVHEFGHLLGIKHCVNFNCVMASSNTIDDLDIKGIAFCEACKKIVRL